MAYETSIYREQGGDRLVVGDGGTLEISGGTLTIDGTTLDIPQPAVADLDQDISATYVEAEVQAISDKLDEALAALRAAGVIAP